MTVRGSTPAASGRSLAVVIPAFGEAACIATTVLSVHRHVRHLFDRVEIIVVDDGSRDGTAAIVADMQGSLPDLQLLRSPVNRGKGAAVREGVLASTAELVLLSDADLSAPIEEIGALLAGIDRGADVVIGSRAMKGSRIDVPQPLHRRAMGGIFAMLARLATGLPYRDTQCGFKLFTREAARLIFQQARIDGFSFDVEALFIAKRAGLRVEEVPIRWSDNPDSRVRLVVDSVLMVADLARIRLNAARGVYVACHASPDRGGFP